MEEQITSTAGVTDRFNDRTLDRRRAGRGSTALILKAGQALPATDRALLHAVFEDGEPTAKLARLRGLSPRTVTHHVRRLSHRVLSPEFAFVVANRRGWPRTRAKVATACFVQGRSIREAARLARLSFHAARRHHEAVLALMQATSDGDRLSERGAA
jgi:hypothetical protein